MTLLIKSGDGPAFAEWRDTLAECLPRMPVHHWADPAIDPERVNYVVVWEPDPGRLASFPNLRVIFSAAAGVDHIVRDPHLPTHLPLVRMTTAEQAQLMGEYVSWAALSLLRQAPAILALRATRRFDTSLSGQMASDTRVGVMGLGALGARPAEMLVALGFQVAGWTTSAKSIAGVENFVGEGAFAAFLARTDILVCLLPLTPSTAGIIRAETLALLPKGAGIVNVGRGGHVNLPDLIAALDSGHINAAVLDVFDPEPLPPESPAWSHPAIIVTPHVASFGSRRVRARHVARQITAFENGEALMGVYDPLKGY